MGCKCDENCKNYGKPGCLCALRERTARRETVEGSGAEDLE
ncbi:MAG TPA: hypothetical protein VK436_16500 [Methanocella sp.]|nr:hypothetical protein [Methanocella sp.]